MPTRPDATQQQVELVNARIKNEDMRCAYCGSSIYCTTNDRGFFVFVCDECGPLMGSSASLPYTFSKLLYDGTVLTRHGRERLRLSEQTT